MFSNAVKLVTIGGFDIKVDPSWLIIAGLITWSLSEQYFPSLLPDQMPATYLMMALSAMLLFFVSLLLHEMAHSVVARRFGVPVKRITLFLFGGVAELEAEPKSAGVEFWVALAGPVMSLALSLGFWVLGRFAEGVSGMIATTAVLTYLAMINLVLALFNLIPAFPLDGGRILRAVLWHRSGQLLDATRTAAAAGTVFAYALMTLGLIALFLGQTLTGFWQILLGAFLLFAARSSYQTQRAMSAFEGKTVRTLMNSSPVVVSPDTTLSEFANRIMLLGGVSFAPVVEDGVLLGHMDRVLLSKIDRENWGSMRVGDVFEGLDPATTVPPELPAPQLLKRITETGRRKFLVVRDHRLEGVITLADLTRYLRAFDD
ncbi:site-2 protease family protein [Roseobacter sinensis]|uniref:Zinc metalloprotease n=1 Tax=Roseobacter sinensis TaxID=2931391 RepID=A0ABT3BD54_9RHOB|nr:site-2 protease family protein [Roseobacter sp. WL0113]MCV3271498.1 site-2 protease family protein [Roseobacter sp. WL0113]